MNPLTNVKNITKLNEIELSKGTTDKKSWHDIYKGSAWIFIGGLAYGLTEGDVLAVFSQYGEIVNINLVRDKKTGKTKGFCFLCYANQKSTVLAVDNLNGIKLLNRTIRVDHVANYKPPKDNEHDDEVTKILKSEGCAPKPIMPEVLLVDEIPSTSTKKKKSKKEKKKHKKDKKSDKSLHKKSKIKKEKHDPGYDKYELPENSAKHLIKSNKNQTIDNESSTTGDSSDEIHGNNKTQPKEKHHNKNDTSRNKSPTNDFSEYNRDGGGKYSSGRKRRSRESESDSEDNYVKQKKTKASHSKGEKVIPLENSYNKRKSQYRHNSDSSESVSPANDQRRYSRKDIDFDHHTASHLNSSRNAHVSDTRRNVIPQRRRSSSSEEVQHSLSNSRERYVSKLSNRPGDRDDAEYSRPESSQHKEYDRNNSKSNKSDRMLSNVDNYGDGSFARDRGDHRHNDYGDHRRNNDQSYIRNNDARESHLHYDGQNRSFARDRGDHINSDYRDDKRNNDQSDIRNSDARESRLHYGEQIHSRKYSDKNDRKSYDYKNEDRNSSKYSKNVRSSSNEREEKHSNYRGRDNNGKDWYDRKKR